jgi:hypothetical protein
MVGAELVVAVADEDPRARSLAASPDEADHVERRLVGPMRVLYHHDGLQAELLETALWSS